MKTRNILLVEDNEGDIVLTLEAFKDGGVANKVSVLKDGQEAIRFLNKEGKYIKEKTPDMVLLDINLPKVDGKDVLKYIKSSDYLKSIPVIIFTTSSSEKDIQDCYNNYANCYITKPDNFNKFQEAIHTIENFWTAMVQLGVNKT